MAGTKATVRYDLHSLRAAAQALAEGRTVAFPTETVYGLGANALDSNAVQAIFEAKGRPQDNPLIVHVSDRGMLDQVARSLPSSALVLMEAFWPGPLTVLVEKHDRLPDAVTAGLNTVAVRMPQDPIAIELIRLAGVPLVAPSANLSGRPSGTTWQAVLEDLNGRVDGIVCGPPTRVGLESTVVDTWNDPPRVLRHGAIPWEVLQRELPELVDYTGTEGSDLKHAVRSPGTRHRHYQPRARVRVIANSENPSESAMEQPCRRGWIGVSEPPRTVEYEATLLCPSVEAYASQLFETFRRWDAMGIEVIDCQAVPEVGLGRALMDRLKRASE